MNSFSVYIPLGNMALIMLLANSKHSASVLQCEPYLLEPSPFPLHPIGLVRALPLLCF